MDILQILLYSIFVEDILGTLKIKVHWAAHGELNTGWNYPDVNDFFGRIYCTKSGKGFMTHHNKKFALESGKMHLIPPYSHMKGWCPDKMHQYWIHFNAEVLTGVELFDIMPPSYEIKLSDQTTVLKTIEKLINIFKSTDTVKQFEADAIVRSFILRFIKDSKINQEKMNTVIRFKPALSYIEDNLAGPIEMKTIASLSGLHPTYFSNLFCKYMKIPPLKYINSRRIEKAKALLFVTEESIEQIAEKTGMDDQFYFSRLFKKLTGVSPLQYRKKIRKISS